MLDQYLNMKRNSKILKYIEFIGIYSYGIYLTEGIIIHHLNEVFPVSNKLLQDLFLMIVSVLGAVIIMKLVKKIQTFILC